MVHLHLLRVLQHVLHVLADWRAERQAERGRRHGVGSFQMDVPNEVLPCRARGSNCVRSLLVLFCSNAFNAGSWSSATPRRGCAGRPGLVTSAVAEEFRRSRSADADRFVRLCSLVA